LKMADLVRDAADRGDAGGDVGGVGGGGNGALGEALRGAPPGGGGAGRGGGPVVVRPHYGARFGALVRDGYGPDASGVEGTATIRNRFLSVIRDVPEFVGVQVEQLPEFRLGLAADAIVNQSSARGIEVSQTMVFFFGEEAIQVSRAVVLAAMFETADFENVQLTRVHRGVRPEINKLLKDVDFVNTLSINYGITDPNKRMDYLRGNFRFDKVERAAAVSAVLTAAEE
jgi:hypothetical protein